MVFKKGHIAWNKGIPRTEEEKIKMRKPHLSRRSKPTWNKGLTKETNEIVRGIGEKHKGKSGMLGKKHSDKYKEKMSELMKGNKNGIGNKSRLGERAWNKGIKGKNSHSYGKSISIQTREKISIGNSGKIRSEETKQKLRDLRLKQIFPMKDTKIEVKIQMFLKELGYEFFTHQCIKEIEHKYQCDILIPALNLVIECDGDYWHKYPVGLEKDHIRTKELIEKGFKVLRLWEREIKIMDINNFKEKLKDEQYKA